MTKPLYHYSLDQVVVTFGPVLVQGLGDDDAITVRPNSDDTELFVGPDSATRTMTTDNSAMIEVVLSQSSPTNGLLSAISKIDRRTGQGIWPMMVKDLSGAALFLAPRAWIKRRPDRVFGKSHQTRTWMFETHDLVDFDGGALPPLPPAPLPPTP